MVKINFAFSEGINACMTGKFLASVLVVYKQLL
jgi:hypothetical protein